MNPVMICKALGQPQRYALFLDLLKGGDADPTCCTENLPDEQACCVVDLTNRHHLAQSTISHHLQVLVDADLLIVKQRGTYRFYQVNSPIWDAFVQHMTTLSVCVGPNQYGPIGQLSK